MDKKTLIIILEAIVIIFVVFFMWKYFDAKLNVSDQNLKAAKGEITTLKLKNNELLQIRDSYVIKEKDLEEQLGISKKEIKELEKKLDSSITYISNLESQINSGKIITVRDSIVYVSNNLASVNFSYSDKWIKINGVNNLEFKTDSLTNIQTTLNDINITSNLKVGLTDNNQIFVKSDNPYLTFSQIEGAYLDKDVAQVKKVKFSWGFQFGFGVNYGLINKKMDAGPYAGFGIGLSF